MKILFLTDNFPPEVNAPANRTYEHCQEWIRQGVEVTVITCVPNFPQGEVYEGYQNKWYQEEMTDGIRVIRVWSYIAANEGFIKRTLDFLSFGAMAFWHGLFVRTDLIIATSPQFFTAIAGRILSFFKRKPWVMEVRDLWPESIKAVGLMEETDLSYRFLQFLEKSMYRSARIIIVVTDTFKKYIAAKNIESNKIKVVKNGVNLNKIPSPNLLPTRNTIFPNLTGKFIVGYIGTHGMAHKLSFVLNCAARKELNPNIHFLLIGDGAQKKSLRKQYKKLALTNVTMLDPVPKSEVYTYINLLDVALVNLKKSDTFKTVIPSKIFENAAMKKPILLGVEGESAELIQRYEAGLCFEPENEEDFIRQLHCLATNENIYQHKQKGCQHLAQDFSRDSLARLMLTELEKVVIQ